MCRLFYILALINFFILAHASNDDQFIGRSGDIIIQNREQPSAQFSWKINQDVIQESQIYNMFARLFGVPRISSQSELNIYFDPFTKPSGNLLFSIDGLSSGQLKSLNTQILGKEPITNIESHSATPFSVLATALSGVGVASHGVVNDKWPGMDVNDVYNVRNLYDNLLQLHGNKLLAISGSSSMEAAATLAPNKAHIPDSQSVMYHWDTESGEFSAFPAQDMITLNRAQFEQQFESLAALTNLKISYSEETAVVSIKDGEATYLFDLTEEADEMMFAELLFVLKASSLANSEKNILFSFHFQALKLAAAKYGETSATFNLIVTLLDAVIANALKAFPDYSHEMLFFPYNSNNLQVESSVAAAVAPFLTANKQQLNDFAVNYYPHIYLPTDVEKSIVCEQIRTAVDKFSPKPIVICTTTQEKISKKRQVGEGNLIYEDPIKTFHVVVWMSVALISILITALAYLFTIDTGEDTLLFYRTSNMALNNNKMSGKPKTAKV